MATKKPVSRSKTPAVRAPKASPKPQEDPPNWPLRIAWFVASFLVMLQINGYIQKHRAPLQPTVVAPAETNPYTASIAGVFTPGLEAEALEYAAYFEALRNVVETDKVMVPSAVVLKVQEVRNLPELTAIDAVVEAAMSKHTDLPESGGLSPEQVTAVCSTWQRLSEACLAASRD
jgi:hypothetical protein